MLIANSHFQGKPPQKNAYDYLIKQQSKLYFLTNIIFFHFFKKEKVLITNIEICIATSLKVNLLDSMKHLLQHL